MRIWALTMIAAGLALTGCGASAADESDPMLNCINATVDYGLAEDRQDAAETCQWLTDKDVFLGGPFDDVFASVESSAEWARSELAKP